MPGILRNGKEASMAGERGSGERARSHRFFETISGSLTLMLRELGKATGGF